MNKPVEGWENSLVIEITSKLDAYEKNYGKSPSYLILSHVFLSRLQTEMKTAIVEDPVLFPALFIEFTTGQFAGMEIILVKSVYGSFSGWAFGE